MWRGQWIGFIEGTNRGFLSLNIEDSLTNASIVVADDDPKKLNFYAHVDFKVNGKNIQGTLSNFLIFDEASSELISSDDFCRRYKLGPKICPRAGGISGVLDDIQNTKKVISGNWKTDVETSGTFQVSLKNAEFLSPDQKMSWQQFKTTSWASRDGHIYRGQANPQNHLRTRFHRMEKNDLVVYHNDNVPKLRYFVNSVSKYVYQPHLEDTSGLLGLAQHHGYPTPLLDWSFSPFVAAYFAYESVGKSEQEGDVRIFILNAQDWQKIPFVNKVKSTLDPRPVISAYMVPAHNNLRVVPQQSVTTFSNIDDMQYFFKIVGDSRQPAQKFLRVIDLPRKDRNQAMKDLKLMGITAGSLFPGLDGLCNALCEEDF